MKKSIFLTILLLLTSVFSSLASEENTTAGMYISGLNQLYITADAKGTYSFLLENAREKAQLCPGGNYRALSIKDNVMTYSVGTYTLTLTFKPHEIIATEKGTSPVKVAFAGTYARSVNHVGDNLGYLYSYMNDKTELALSYGGRYVGNVTVPSSVTISGKPIPVTTLRRKVFANRVYHTHLNALSLPGSITMIGVDAARGCQNLTHVNFADPKKIYIEKGAFVNCPNLIGTDAITPFFAYTEPYVGANGFTHFIRPTSIKSDIYNDIRWAFNKQNHSSASFAGMQNLDSKTATESFGIWKNVKGAVFSLNSRALVKELFNDLSTISETVILTDNAYIATHDFPTFTRWVLDEQRVSMGDNFIARIKKKYNREIKYCYRVASIQGNSNSVGVDTGVLAITEFEPKDGKALVVLSWVEAGYDVCRYEITTPASKSKTRSVWDKDDNGDYGIPNVVCIARDSNGNVDLFLEHSAPKSRTLMYLRQDGSTFTLINSEKWDVYN